MILPPLGKPFVENGLGDCSPKYNCNIISVYSLKEFQTCLIGYPNKFTVVCF